MALRRLPECERRRLSETADYDRAAALKLSAHRRYGRPLAWFSGFNAAQND